MRASLNLSQRLVRMARHTADGRLEAEQMARRLREDGKSRQHPNSLARLIRKNLNLNPLFRELGNDWFQLVDFTPGHPVRSEPDDTGRDSTMLNGYQVPRLGRPPGSALNGNYPAEG